MIAGVAFLGNPDICESPNEIEIKAVASNKSQQCSSLEKLVIWWSIKLRILFYVCTGMRQPLLIWKTYRALLKLRSNVWGGDLKKLYKVDGKYYFNQYTPGWPSKAYDQLIKREIRRHRDPLNIQESLSFIFLAITRKCPMQCEHCFEWHNLNKKETFTKEDLVKVVDIYQKEGVLQFHFSGGEPMVRFKDLLQVMKFASKNSECWVITSGFNLTTDNAQLLKSAGCTGVVVSIDHYKADLHNIFRGNEYSFQSAVNAVQAVKAAGMVVSISVCATKTFLDGGHLMPYMDFAKKLEVHFVQVLEPKDVGHYEEKDVLLTSRHIAILDIAFKRVNHSKDYRHYPTMLYHGYHQRRIGCFSGSRSVYIDSAGDVHACPFCHTKSYNILDVIRTDNYTLPQKENVCPRYKKVI